MNTYTNSITIGMFIRISMPLVLYASNAQILLYVITLIINGNEFNKIDLQLKRRKKVKLVSVYVNLFNEHK